MIIHVQSVMGASRISTTGMKTPCDSTSWEDTTVFASLATWAMEPHAKHFTKMAAVIEEPASPLRCVPAS